MGKKSTIAVINVITIIMLVTCLTLCVLLIMLSASQKSIESVVKNGDGLKNNYTQQEQIQNTWEISATEDDNVIATLSNDGILTISGTGEMKDWSWSSTEDWHGMRENVKKVIIENGVTNIGYWAFCRCESLITVEIPEGVIWIGDYAFIECYSLTNIEIPEGVIWIGNSVFASCISLINIEIPKTVTSIGEDAFCYCYELTSIKVAQDNVDYKDEEGVLYTKDGKILMAYPLGNLKTQYRIISGTQIIGRYAFDGCRNLTSIEIPEGVTSIGDYVFSSCTSLINIEIPEGVTSIGNHAFGVCESLTNIKIPKGVTSIGDYAFKGCQNLTSIEIPEGVTSIGESAFMECYSLINVEIPEGVTSIGKSAFYRCYSLINVEIPEGVTSIGDYAFRECDSLTNIEIPKGVTSIGDYAFRACYSLKNIEIPEGVISIGDYAFSGCDSLTSIEIPSTVTSIGEDIFKNCIITQKVGLNYDIELPDIFKRVQDEKDLLYSNEELKFTNCTIEDKKIKIIDINSYAMLEVIQGKCRYLKYMIVINPWDISATENDNVIATLSEDGTLTISGTGKMKDWISPSSREWNVMKNKIKTVIIENGVTNIGKYAFYMCESLNDVKIPEGVTSIGDDAFVWCESLTNIKIPEGVTSIGNGAFDLCDRLINIEIPSSVTRIGEDAFRCCEDLTSIKVAEDNVNYKDEEGVLYTKDGNTLIAYPLGSLKTQYRILSGTQIIEENAFNGCKNLTSIEIPNSVTSIGEDAFAYCIRLTSINIPDSVTSVGGRAFYSCHVNKIMYTANDTIEMPNILKRVQDENDILYSNRKFNLQNCTIDNNTIKINDVTNLATIGVESGALEGFEYHITYNTWDISQTENDKVKATLSEDGTLTISGTGKTKGWSSNSTIDWHSVRDRVKNVVIEKGVTSIGDYAFYMCNRLTNIEIPSNVTRIGFGAFDNCKSLTSIEVEENNKEYKDEDGVLYTKNGLRIIKYPEGKTEKQYKILKGTVRIEDYAFTGCEKLTSIYIPESVKIIGEEVFAYSPNVTIICNKDTVAEIYVKENNIKYIIKIDEINPKTTVKQFKEKLSNETEYEITNQNGERILEIAYVGTGYKVKKADGTIYTIIVTGDASGDGQADIKDILAINKHRLNKAMLEVQYLFAADVNEDEKADIKDILQINKFRLGKIEGL